MISHMFVQELPPDKPHGDIPHDEETLRGFQAHLDGKAPHFDAEVISPVDQSTMWVRVWPKELNSNPNAPQVWNIDHGTCQLLNENTGLPYGPEGSCNGYITTVPSPGHTIGKLQIKF